MKGLITVIATCRASHHISVKVYMYTERELFTESDEHIFYNGSLPF